MPNTPEPNPEPTTKKRMGRPPKPTVEKATKIGAKDEYPIVKYVISINQEERNLLTQIALAHNCKNISFLNRALARGEILILKLNTQEFNSLKSYALASAFNSVEDCLRAIATHSFPIPGNSNTTSNSIPKLGKNKNY